MLFFLKRTQLADQPRVKAAANWKIFCAQPVRTPGTNARTHPWGWTPCSAPQRGHCGDQSCLFKVLIRVSMCCTQRPQLLINTAYVRGFSYHSHSSLIQWWPGGRGLVSALIRGRHQSCSHTRADLLWTLTEMSKEMIHTSQIVIAVYVKFSSFMWDIWDYKKKICPFCQHCGQI